MKKILILLVIVFAFISCEKDNYERKVKYLVTKSISGFDVTFLNENGDMIKESIIAGSENDQWTYSYDAGRGDIVYISVLDTLPTSFVKVQILVDGKIYKQASRDDDYMKPLTVSGVVPI